MPMIIEQQAVTLSHERLSPTRGQVAIAHYDPYSRIKNTFKWWGGSWLAAIISIFLPILHFFLVPSFLIAGPILGFFKWRQTSRMIGGFGPCPLCQATTTIAKGPDHWPIEAVCSQCKRHLKIEKESRQLKND